MYKVLLLNNENPQKFNVAFWADHFQISPAAIRNIVNYVAYPLVDQETKKVVKVMTFIDSDLQKLDMQLIGELNRDNYFKYLEADYSKRLKDQYSDEQGLFGKVFPTAELPPGQESARLEDYMISQQEKVARLIADTSTLERVDKEI